MKTSKLKKGTILLVAALMVAGLNTFAQRGRAYWGQGQNWENFRCPMLDLTEEQQTQIKDLRLAHMKGVNPLRDQLVENMTHNRTLLNAEKPDMKAISNNIDKRTELQNKLAKLNADFRVKFRSVLTEEQQLMIGSRGGRFGGQGFYGRRGRGNFRMSGNCPGFGRGYRSGGYGPGFERGYRSGGYGSGFERGYRSGGYGPGLRSGRFGPGYGPGVQDN
jgi:Spy/CpxP family protein refolding chaperone